MTSEDVKTGASITSVPPSGTDAEHSAPSNPQIEGLDEQIAWYDQKSHQAQVRFKWLKGVEITAAACIPLIAAYSGLNLIAGMLGVLVTVIEGLLHLNQYQHNWISYRATCEALRHERHLYLAGAGVYANAARPRALLSERVEALLTREVARWEAFSVNVNGRTGRQEP
ncbi:MAG TPA: DUF4231 domain-containing protein [Chloroflexota bacterium]|jgi:hypothetical protein